MTALTLAGSRITAGRWIGLLLGEAASPPAVEIVHRERPLDGVSVEGADGRWTVSVRIPDEAISDGVQTFLVRQGGTGDELGAFTLVAGSPLEADIRAEVDLLRAELDLLKKAFRRHCLDTGG
jgi:hypothetical protein